jgi:hypothetical protein
MAIAVFLQPQVDLIVHNYLRELKVLAIAEGGQRSQYFKEKSLTSGPPDSTATQLTFQTMRDSDTCILTSSIVATWPATAENPDLTSGYHAATTVSNVFNIGRFASDQFTLADAEVWANAAGRGIVDNQMKLTVQTLLQNVEETFLENCYESASFASGSNSSTGVDFALNTTSDAYIQAGFAQLAYGAASQNWPSGDRFLAVNPIVAANILQYSTKAGNFLYERGGSEVADSANSMITGQLNEFMGFKIVPTNSLTDASKAVAFTTSNTALVMPRGVMIEELRYIGSWAEFVRLRILYGVGVLGPRQVPLAGNTGAGVQGWQGALRITCTNA